MRSIPNGERTITSHGFDTENGTCQSSFSIHSSHSSFLKFVSFPLVRHLVDLDFVCRQLVSRAAQLFGSIRPQGIIQLALLFRRTNGETDDESDVAPGGEPFAWASVASDERTASKVPSASRRVAETRVAVGVLVCLSVFEW